MTGVSRPRVTNSAIRWRDTPRARLATYSDTTGPCSVVKRISSSGVSSLISFTSQRGGRFETKHPDNAVETHYDGAGSNGNDGGIGRVIDAVVGEIDPPLTANMRPTRQPKIHGWIRDRKRVGPRNR